MRIGGENAKPILTRWNWFSITLCTTIAVGILFWGAAEPMFHITAPPKFSGVEPLSPQASRFALSSIYMHWTITPYAIYTITALAFTLVHYNHAMPYSLGSPIAFLFSRKTIGFEANIIDAFALFALVAGVAAALGAGVMTVAGGLETLFQIPNTLFIRAIVTITIVSAFIISSISGLHRGIKILSDINARIFFAIAIFVFLAGPSLEIIQMGASALMQYFTDFIPASLALGERSGDSWTRDWPVYFFANWLAWAPITALFLGRIAVGYTVREFLIFNLILPALFSVVWMSIFGVSAIHFNEISKGALVAAQIERGPEAVAFVLLEMLPLFSVVGFIFLVTVFISFVTAMDSNTLSISTLCQKTNDGDDENTPNTGKLTVQLKIFWGVLIGSMSFIMTATSGIDGVRMLSNLGGVPGLVILMIAIATLCKLILVKFNAPHP